VLLVGLQGVLGWLMVKSGLVDRPQVSHLRLTAHLGLALLLLAATLWTAFSLGTRERLPDIPAAARARRWARVVTCLVCVMIVTGGLVAGFRAGYVYNTWPLMNGTLAPSELLLLTPWWRNVVWNMVTIQFDHRMVAYGLLLSVVGLGASLRDPGLPARARRAGLALAVTVVAQAVLGISTLLLVVPILLAVLHQALAVVVFALALHVLYALR
jgi:cytochrome c oxidase assembly protein subunit 15